MGDREEGPREQQHSMLEKAGSPVLLRQEASLSLFLEEKRDALMLDH